MAHNLYLNFNENNNGEGERGATTETTLTPLDEVTRSKAFKELNEDTKDRLEAVECLRSWINTQPAYKYTKFLISFLRARKFSQSGSRDLLKRHLMMKTKMRGWFENVDPCEAGLLAVLKDGFAHPLSKRSPDGCLIVMFNYGKLRPWCGRYTKQDILRAIVCVTYFIFFLNELTQINGVYIVNDLSNMTFKHQTLFSLEEQRLFYGGWHKSIPARIKKICLYNVGSFGDFFFMILKMVTPDKLMHRIINCGSSLEDLSKEIPEECLPVEYKTVGNAEKNDSTTSDNIGYKIFMMNDAESMLEEMMKPEVRSRIMYLSDPQFHMDANKLSSPSVAESFRKFIAD
ncbi:hypothetical protein HELRODRAFT_177959 [Helobdella robusta]|uniref:CRAL-TRIO domain-containing protein n=1 Tax=Helobdella robusta TaxID=6412 RepID=T1FCI7_HELRO|nr:hypothetical protein HELRODRAFT_177959 [Helobdella robusta]ESN97529.1 hypothetical protein HELRODRAFT_177959 [Helobdella robusta]